MISPHGIEIVKDFPGNGWWVKRDTDTLFWSTSYSKAMKVVEDYEKTLVNEKETE